MGSILPPETMSMFMVNIAAKGCVDVCGVCYHQGTMLISMVHAASNAMLGSMTLLPMWTTC